MNIKRIFIISFAILISCSLAFALTYQSSNYTLKNARVVISGGKASSLNYSLNDVRAGNVIAGKAKSPSYSIDAGDVEKPIPPNAPTVNPPTTPTNVPLQTLSGTKDKATSIYINGYQVVPLDNSLTWSCDYTLCEGENPLVITARNKYGLESQSVCASITLDTIAPEVIIASPQKDAVIHTEEVTLAGTIDGVGFSETRTLTSEGRITLTKTAQDEAGNIGSDSVDIYYYSYLGEFVGPEGGEVVSADGKVRLIIPAGALSEPAYIGLLALDKDLVEGAVPDNHSLLSVVACKPNGLNFLKPAELIYTLDEAEVPGTAVELGLHDTLEQAIASAGGEFDAGETGEIKLTGISSSVAIDGYTVNFPISHFSTYAALKNLLPTSGAPIGSGVQIPLPDMLTGAFSHSVSIACAPGRKNIQPNLQLTYRSSNPNSWVGVGFSLNPGYIVRSTRLGPPSYIDTEDTFYFVTDGGTTELVHLIDNLYQARIESAFARFFKEGDDSWRVVQKDGTALYCGQSPESKEPGSGGTYSWYVSRVVDTNGNYVQYNYTQEQGKAYLASVEYTGNEHTDFSPKHKVEFFLEARDDVFSNYLSGTKIATAKRLSKIEAKVNGEMVWRYELGYALSPDTNRSLLKTITQYGSDGKALPAQTFNYQSAK